MWLSLLILMPLCSELAVLLHKLLLYVNWYVVNAEKASCGNHDVMIAGTQLAQTVMRSAIGKMPLDKTFMERDTLNANIAVSFFF